MEEVRRKRAEVTERIRLLLEERMKKAKQNREQQLEAVVKRAKDEEEKASCFYGLVVH